MQATLIDPAKIYAIKVGSAVVRFKVRAVESRLFRRKLKPTSADYEHRIHGTMDERDFKESDLPSDPTERKNYLTRTITPEEVLDEFDRYAELRERAKAEQVQAEATRLAKVKTAKELTEFLYTLTGLPMPKIVTTRNGPFYYGDYNGGIGIENEGIEALLPILQELAGISKINR